MYETTSILEYEGSNWYCIAAERDAASKRRIKRLRKNGDYKK